MRLRGLRQAIRHLGIFVGLLLILATAQPAWADALVSPIRSLLQTPGETVTVTLRNPSNGPRTYRVGWGEYTQSAAGVGGAIPNGAPVPHPVASAHLRLTPRQITVPANSNQTVRVQFRPEPTLPPGEYRSHLVFQVIPELSTPVGSQTLGGSADGITLQVDMQMSIAVPVVVRHQVQSPPTAQIASIQPNGGAGGATPQLLVSLAHSGQASAYGRIRVEVQHAQTAPAVLIGRVDSVSVFPDVGRRDVLVPLNPAEPLRAGSMLRVTFEGTDEYSGVVWDSRTLQIQ